MKLWIIHTGDTPESVIRYIRNGCATWEVGLLEMTREKLKQYQAIKKEIKVLEQSITKLREQAGNVPTVAGTVMASSKDFPYTKTHVTVQMGEPRREDMISRRLLVKERRMEQMETLAMEIETFIADIPDSTNRQIFEMAFLEGQTYQEIGNALGYTKGRISQKISDILKD